MRHNSALPSISLPTLKGFSKVFEIIFIFLSLYCCPFKNFETVFLYSVPLQQFITSWNLPGGPGECDIEWYRLMLECHADIVSSRFTLWCRVEKNNTSVMFRTDQSAILFWLWETLFQESTVTMIRCTFAKCCTACCVGQSLTIFLRDCTINRNLLASVFISTCREKLTFINTVG